MNNSNFGIDCRNNIDNCILGPLYDNIDEISYIKKFTSIFNDDTFRHFFSPQHSREEITDTFNQKILLLDKNEPTYEARKQYFLEIMEEELDAVDSFEKSKKKERKRKLLHIDNKIEDCLDPRKTKVIFEFNNCESASIKLFALKKKNELILR